MNRLYQPGTYKIYDQIAVLKGKDGKEEYDYHGTEVAGEKTTEMFQT